MHKDFLKLGNPKKLVGILEGLIEPDQIERINEQQKLQAQAMFQLGMKHYRFAIAQNQSHWRQRVSRFYYGAYNGSKAIRYMVEGSHSTDSSDHKKIGDLPQDFTNRATYSTRLKELRDDRNKCDYDHGAKAQDLFITQADAESLTRNFLREAKTYLEERGLELRGQI